MLRQLLLLLVVALFGMALAVSAHENETIVFEAKGLLPEGIEWDATGERFLVGSLSTGTISQVLEDGAIEAFIEDEDLVSSVGIHVDVANNRLLVVNSDSQVFSGASSGKASLASYDLETGERIFLAEFESLYDNPAHFTNDVTVDADGNAYVTNSFAPVLYKVDLEGNAELFVEDEKLSGVGFGANGIDYHPDGYLLVAGATDHSLLKIDLESKTVVDVAVASPFTIDGMVLGEDGALYAVLYPTTGQVIAKLTSEDDWASATVEVLAETEGNATTLALHHGVPYYINAYLNAPDQETYEIVPVEVPAK